jgi:elongation factor 1-gamma
MPYTLYSTSAVDSRAVGIAAALAGLDIKIEDVKTVHDKSPANQGPVLDTGAGYIFGTGAVLRWVARAAGASGLYGASNYDAAAVDQWVDHVHSSLRTSADAWLTPIVKNKEVEPAAYKANKAGTVSALRALNNPLLNSQYIVGNTITIADIYTYAVCVDLMQIVLAPPTLRPCANVLRWFTTLRCGEPAFALTEFEACGKEKFAPKKKVEKPKAKQEKKAAAAAPVKKKVNPLLLLPESKMVLDQTKKNFFLTQPFNPDFFTNFWGGEYDPAGYCCYSMHYKYDEENEQYWLTQNLLGGFLQRLDPARKFAFGVMTLSGADEDTKPWEFKGAWIFRGPGVPFEISDCSQSPQFDWNPIDVSKPEGRAELESYFIGETVNGKTVLDRRYFK